MIPYARLTPGPGFRPERAFFYYAQRLVTVPAARRAVSGVIAAGLNFLQGDRRPVAADAYGARVLEELGADGVSVLAPLAPRPAVERIAAYFMERPVLGPDGRPTPLADLPAGCAAAAYPLQTVLDCPGLLALVNAASILQIAAAYLGCKPTLSSLGVRWSLPAADEASRFQSFHRDVDDWRFLKLFVYLTEVGEDAGPHAYVLGSHRRAFGLRERSYSSREIAARFGADKVRAITGEPGTTFVADTLGVHCGTPPVARPRLILQAQYSLLPVYAFRYEPAEARAGEVDPYCNRLLVRRPAQAQAG